MLIVALAPFCLASACSTARSQTLNSDSLEHPLSSDPSFSQQSPSQDELQSRLKKLIANQHSDDAAESQYEWIEHHVSQAGGANGRTPDEKTIRLVPNGAGTTKLILAENGKPTDSAESRRQLENLVQVLQMMLNPNDSRMKSASAKYQKRMHDRSELVDSVAGAFLITWQRREIRNGRDCDVIQVNPSPSFHPHSLFQDALTHVTANVWVDHTADQIVHADAKVLSDIGFGGGLIGKLYRGGTVSIDQAEIASGVWLVTHERYDFSGRKFLFPFEEHQQVDFSHFRFVGSPKDALVMVQAELANGKPASGDP